MKKLLFIGAVLTMAWLIIDYILCAIGDVARHNYESKRKGPHATS